jgi:hypothetical protein
MSEYKLLEPPHDIGEIVTVGDRCVDVDDVGAVRARDHHGRRIEREMGDVADAHDRAVCRTERNGKDVRQALHGGPRVDDLDLDQAVGRFEFGGNIAAEGGANRRRRGADRDANAWATFTPAVDSV